MTTTPEKEKQDLYMRIAMENQAKQEKERQLSGDTFVMDFSKPGDPYIGFKKNEVSENQILLCSGLKDCIMIEKINLK